MDNKVYLSSVYSLTVQTKIQNEKEKKNDDIFRISVFSMGYQLHHAWDLWNWEVVSFVNLKQVTTKTNSSSLDNKSKVFFFFGLLNTGFIVSRLR